MKRDWTKREVVTLLRYIRRWGAWVRGETTKRPQYPIALSRKSATVTLATIK